MEGQQTIIEPYICLEDFEGTRCLLLTSAVAGLARKLIDHWLLFGYLIVII